MIEGSDRFGGGRAVFWDGFVVRGAMTKKQKAISPFLTLTNDP